MPALKQHSPCKECVCVCLLLYFFLPIRWLRSFCHHLSHPSMWCQSKTNEIEPAVAEENNNTHKPKQIQTHTHTQTDKQKPISKTPPHAVLLIPCSFSCLPLFLTWCVWDKKHFISILRSNNMPSFLMWPNFFFIPLRFYFR